MGDRSCGTRNRPLNVNCESFSDFTLTLRTLIKGKKLLLCNPFLYKSSGCLLEVATTTTPLLNNSVNSLFKIIASAISVTWKKQQSETMMWKLRYIHSRQSSWTHDFQKSSFPSNRVYMRKITVLFPDFVWRVCRKVLIIMSCPYLKAEQARQWL